MIAHPRPTLSLSGLLKPEEDRDLELASYDVLLPCRRFEVDHKVAVLGRVSLTAEFLLRLVKSADGIDETDAALFFGFGLRDMSFVLAEVEGLGYVERREGRLWITLSGMSLFLEGSEEPKIFEVEVRRENVGFDLISLAYEQPRGLDEFSRTLPELPLLHPERASAAASNIYSAFRRSYPEIISRRERSLDRRSLYSIDHVSAGDRFSSPVKLTIQSTGLRPWVGVADLTEWRNEVEQEDRPEVLDAVAAFVDDLSVSQRSGDQDGYEALISLAPEFLKEFVRKDGLAVDKYYRETINRVGEVRSNRQTIPFVGSLFTRDNVRKLTEAYSIGLRSQSRPSTLLWLMPIVKYWGATRTLPELLRTMASRIGADNSGERPATTTVGLVSGWPEAHIKKAFGQVCKSDAPAFPQMLEILLVPGVVVAASVHAPIGSKTGLPVPLGFISFDPRVIERASDYLDQSLHRYVKDDMLDRRIREDLARKTDAEVEASSIVQE
ncbi:hypothetical protein [Devosia naphthalenivorans]|uniref:hypothetical protein n=1 Tax=Devosia naphthalenivorans TaxID=2082392 RepID=UPI000D366764|nr:hypothetical protein [Devosia naphthalenivorans]